MVTANCLWPVLLQLGGKQRRGGGEETLEQSSQRNVLKLKSWQETGHKQRDITCLSGDVRTQLIVKAELAEFWLQLWTVVGANHHDWDQCIQGYNSISKYVVVLDQVAPRGTFNLDVIVICLLTLWHVGHFQFQGGGSTFNSLWKTILGSFGYFLFV